MRRLAVLVEEAMTKALGRAPNVVTMGQFYRALTAGNAARKPHPHPRGGDVPTADELASWVPVAPPGATAAAGPADPFMWLELSGIVWTRGKSVHTKSTLSSRQYHM